MGQWALTFDVTFQYPVGPVCNWPNIIDCTLTCSEDDECQENSDCSLCSGGYCNMDCGCTYPTPCQCSSDQDCDQFDGICDVPSPHHPQYCSYCDDTGLCKGGNTATLSPLSHLASKVVLTPPTARMATSATITSARRTFTVWRTLSVRDTTTPAMCITTTASTVAELAGPTMAVVLDVMTVISTVNTPHQSAMATLIFVDVGMTQTAM